MTDPRALWDITYGMYTLCAYDQANLRHSGCIVNTLMQVTAIPELMAVSISKENHTHQLMLETGRFVVSVLSEQTSPLVISALGFSSGAQRNKLEKVDVLQTPSGAVTPSDNICAWLEFEIIGQTDVGTHTVFTAKHIASQKVSELVPMTYGYYHNVIRGKAPKNAPTYQAPATK